MSVAAGLAGAVEVDPGVIQIEDLAPGVPVASEVTLTNGSAVPVLVSFTQTDAGPLLEGATPLEVTYAWADPAVAACDGAPVLPAGSSLELTVVAALPVDAGDDYQGATGSSTLAYTATELPGGVCPGAGSVGGGAAGGGSGDGLALTGTELGGLLAAAALLVTAGVALVRTRLATRRPDRGRP